MVIACMHLWIFNTAIEAAGDEVALIDPTRISKVVKNAGASVVPLGEVIKDSFAAINIRVLRKLQRLRPHRRGKGQHEDKVPQTSHYAL